MGQKFKTLQDLLKNLSLVNLERVEWTSYDILFKT